MTLFQQSVIRFETDTIHKNDETSLDSSDTYYYNATFFIPNAANYNYTFDTVLDIKTYKKVYYRGGDECIC